MFFLAVEDGLRLRFWIGKRPELDVSDQDIDKAHDCLSDRLEFLWEGSKTAVGYGRFVPHGKEKKRQAEERDLDRCVFDIEKRMRFRYCEQQVDDRQFKAGNIQC